MIPNGVSAHVPSSDAERQALRGEFGIEPDAPVIGSVGRLATVKGYDRLLGALPGVARAHPGVVLLLIGDGPERGELETQANGLGMRERVRFAGFRADARGCYDIMDLFVLSSRSEGMPVALLEAMAAECPVAVTSCGEQPAVVADGAAGILLPDDDSSWETVLIALLSEDARADNRKRAEAGRRLVGDRYTVERTLDAYESLYRELVPPSC